MGRNSSEIWLSGRSGAPSVFPELITRCIFDRSQGGERNFYEIEAAQQGWTLRELRRQFDAGLYERLALSRDKQAIRDLARQGQHVTKPQDLLKDPYVLEFLGIAEKARYSESDLESAIVTHIENFLLELGKGFLFESRQKRFTFDEEHYFVDLVFYNRLLRSYVLIDLKIGKLTHQDLGYAKLRIMWGKWNSTFVGSIEMNARQNTKVRRSA